MAFGANDEASAAFLASYPRPIAAYQRLLAAGWAAGEAAVATRG